MNAVTDTPAEVAEYPDVDHEALGDLYIKHVAAMTREGLHAKSDIAAQLAARDAHIADLERQLAEARADADILRNNLEAQESCTRQISEAFDERNETCAALTLRLEAAESQLAAQRERDGRVLVPREPTPEMLEAPSTIIQPYGARLIWQRMIDAALKDRP